MIKNFYVLIRQIQLLLCQNINLCKKIDKEINLYFSSFNF